MCRGGTSSAGILPRMKISIVLFHIKNFHFMHVSYITFKKKTSTCGSHLDCSVDQWVNRCDSLSTLIAIAI